MLKYIRLQSINDGLFIEAWKLYELSFPADERRLLTLQKELFKLSNYHFEIVLQQKNFIGFILWWDFDDFRFIEHIATTASIRGKGLGAKIITRFQQENTKAIILEVDLPKDDLSHRRIHFYERLGFKLNHHPYQQPALNPYSKPVSLKLMSYPQTLTLVALSQFISKCHPVVYPRLQM